MNNNNKTDLPTSISESGGKFSIICQEICVPTLYLGLLLIFGYPLLVWFLFSFFHIGRITDEVIFLGIPLALPWLPTLIWLRPRYKLLLNFNNGKHPADALLLVVCVSISVSTCLFVNYSQKAWASLVSISAVQDIDAHTGADYFEIQNFVIDTDNLATASDAVVSGKNNQYLTLNLYLVSPIANNGADIGGARTFVVHKDSRRISNRLDLDAKKKIFTEFHKKTFAAVRENGFSHPVYFERVHPSRDLDSAKEAVLKAWPITGSSAVFLMPKYEAFSERVGDDLLIFLGVLACGTIAFVSICLFVRIDKNQLELYRISRKSETSLLRKFMNEAVFDGTLYATKSILLLLIVFYIYQLANGAYFSGAKSGVLVDLGASNLHHLKDGQIWRLLTSTLLHGDIFHLLINAMGLLVCGLFMESELGVWRFTVLFFVSGVVGMLTSAFLTPEIISVGASGGIYGILGAAIAYSLFGGNDRRIMWHFLIPVLMIAVPGFALGIFNVIPNIDNNAHFGGILCGFVIIAIMLLLKKWRGS